MHMRYTMRQMVGLVVGVGALGLFGCGGSTYVATTNLTGGNEVPTNTSKATGTATATLDGSELTVQGTFSGLESNLLDVSGSAAHVHQGAQGTSGGIVFGLKITTTDQRNGSFQGTQKLDSDQVSAYKGGLLYVNVHTTGNSGGEIRGQFQPLEQK